jgi:polysaccharide biosynthesis protein PelC
LNRALLVIITLLLTGCSVATTDQWVRPGATPIVRLAVLPFDNQTPAVRAGAIVADVLASELLVTGGVPIADPGEVGDVLRRESLDPIDITRWPAPVKLGRLLQVSHVLQGAVTEYRYKPGLSETPVVGVTARVVDVATGDVVWTATHAASGSTWFREDGLARVVQTIARDMAAHLSASLRGARPPR